MLTSIYGSTESNVRLPDVGAWILVRVTGIENPSHFRVQLPFGVENLASQLIASIYMMMIQFFIYIKSKIISNSLNFTVEIAESVSKIWGERG